jgi:hypothetical protein
VSAKIKIRAIHTSSRIMSTVNAADVDRAIDLLPFGNPCFAVQNVVVGDGKIGPRGGLRQLRSREPSRKRGDSGYDRLSVKSAGGRVAPNRWNGQLPRPLVSDF